jgi:predicted CXXCH cytochrome family protein
MNPRKRLPRLDDLRASWESIRPRTMRGAARGIGLVAGSAVVIAVVLFAILWVGLAMAAPYLEVTLFPERNAQALAGLELKYAGVATCATCHEPEVTRLVSSMHADIGCESCHGALNAHALSSPGPEADRLIETPTAELCVKCHEQTAGRPEGFPQVEVADHYIDTCLACHNPHSGVSKKPPVVVHPIDGLPACITCHADGAFKAREIRHPKASEDDKACIACHELRPVPHRTVKP